MVKQSRLKPLPEDSDKALAVVDHPDDLEYGAASAAARWTSQRKQVSYMLVTRGEAGIDSLKQHRVYLENLSSVFDPDVFLRKMAAETGNRLRCRFAVSFEVYEM